MNISYKLLGILSIFVCLLLVACIAGTVLLAVLGIRADLYVKKGPVDTQEASDGVTLGPTVDYGEIYLEQAIIFCDSTLSGVTQYEILRDTSVIVSGRNQDMPLDFNTPTAETDKPTEDGKARSIIDIVGATKPQYLIISIGASNGVAHCSEQRFIEYYKKLIDAVKAASPETKIILQSVFPVSKQVSKSTPAISNTKIDTANEWIRTLCQSEGLRYLNTAQALKDKDGALLADYDSGDGIHLNEQGYKKVIEYVRTHGYR
jgi:hypothetical protein